MLPISSSSPSSSMASSSSKELSPVLELSKGLLCILRGWLSIIINHSAHQSWCFSWSLNLYERMFMIESLFTNFAVVKVLTLAAFVSDTNDRACTTAITSNIVVGDNIYLLVRRRLFEGSAKFFAFHQLFKNLRTNFVKLNLDQFLNCLSWRETFLAESLFLGDLRLLLLLITGLFLFSIFIEGL